MSRVLVIGCGNVGSVGLHKMAQNPNVFSDIHVVTRSGEKSREVQESILQRTDDKVLISCHLADVGKKEELMRLLRAINPELVVHWGHPYDNLVIMDACLEAGVNYIDTACYEDPKEYGFSYAFQWMKDEVFRRAELLVVLGCGFDPGVTNIFSAYARDYLFREVHTIDILDCNGGSKDAKIKFAPNFDPEINLRELILPVNFWQNGEWKERGRLIDEDAIHFNFEFPETGNFTPYLMYHEEMESLVKHMPHLKRIRFWMTFDKRYLNYLRVLYELGLIRIDPVDYEGYPVVPVKFLKALLPKGEDFNEGYRGKTCIGNIISGIGKDGQEKVIYIYNVCDHQKAFKETGGNAIGYTTAVPTVVGAKLILERKWQGAGVLNVEDPRLDSKIFLKELTLQWLPWRVHELPALPEFLKKDL